MPENVKPALHGESCLHCGAKLAALFRCIACGATSQARAYRVARVIAQTPHSRMYLADDGQGHKVALKELIFSLVPSIEALEAFEREAAFLRRLKHPQIPRFVDSFQLGEGVHTRLYLAQEFIEGESLAGRIEKGPLNEAQIVDIGRQVLKILVYLHGQVPKTIHRDIKPQNLILQPSGQIALVDFGAARDLSATQTHGSTLVGTFGYMPPEQLGGTVDQTSDLYALGASLLHAATGKRPDVWIRDGIAPDLSRAKLPLSRSSRRWLLKLAEPRRSARHQSAVDALREIDDTSRGKRRAALAALALGAIFAIGGAWMILRSMADAISPAFERGNTQRLLTESIERRLEGAAPSSVGSEPRPGEPITASDPLEQEALRQLRALFVAEMAYFAEKDTYSDEMRAIGFEPDPWCPDGARRQIKKSGAKNEAIGCHFIYSVELDGSGPGGKFVLYARGAAAPALGLNYSVRSDGENRGIPQKVAGHQ